MQYGKMQTKITRPNTYGAQSAQTQTQNSEKAPPEKKFRSGAVVATVWNNQSIKDGKVSEYKTVSFERSFQDKDGSWKTTRSLRVTDIPRAELVLRKAFEYLALSPEQGRSSAATEEEIVY